MRQTGAGRGRRGRGRSGRGRRRRGRRGDGVRHSARPGPGGRGRGWRRGGGRGRCEETVRVGRVLFSSVNKIPFRTPGTSYQFLENIKRKFPDREVGCFSNWVPPTKSRFRFLHESVPFSDWTWSRWIREWGALHSSNRSSLSPAGETPFSSFVCGNNL